VEIASPFIFTNLRPHRTNIIINTLNNMCKTIENIYECGHRDYKAGTFFLGPHDKAIQTTKQIRRPWKCDACQKLDRIRWWQFWRKERIVMPF
jgi:hypothetical protein